MRQSGVTYIGSGFAVWVRAVVVFIAGGVLLGLGGCGGSDTPAVTPAGEGCPTEFVSVGGSYDPVKVPNPCLRGRRIPEPEVVPVGNIYGEGCDAFGNTDTYTDSCWWPLAPPSYESKDYGDYIQITGENIVIQAVDHCVGWPCEDQVYEIHIVSYHGRESEEGIIYVHNGPGPGRIITVATASPDATVATSVTVTNPVSEAAECSADAKKCIRMVPDGRTVEFTLLGAMAGDWVVTGCPAASIEALNLTSGALAAKLTMVASADETCQVEINRPVASFTLTPNPALVGQMVNYDASASSVPIGTIVSYEWDYSNDGVIDATGPTAQTSFNAEGTYTSRLRVTSSSGAIAETTQVVTVSNNTFTLSVLTTDGGSITSSVGGINCQANNAGTCAANFLSGATVTLNALPAMGYQFAGWTGDADCSDGVVTMDSAHSCVATFAVAAASWRALGGALNRDPARSARSPELAASSTGDIYAAWTEAGTGEVSSGGVFVSRWSGSGWVAIGGGLEVNANTSAAYGAQIASDGSPLVAWIEGGDVYMKRWDGTNWIALGGNAIVGVSGNNFANQIDLAVDSLGRPVMAIEQGQSGSFNRDIYVRRFENGAWTTLGFIFGDAFTRISASSLVIDSSDAPVVAFGQLNGFNGATVVSRYDVTATFGNFRSVGGDMASETGFNTTSPSLAIDASGNFVVAYTRTGGTVRDTIITRRFDGTVWTNLTTSVANVSADQSAASPKLLRGVDNNLYVAFAERGTATPSTFIYVRRLNGSAWETVGATYVEAQNAYLTVPSLVSTSAGLAASWESLFYPANSTAQVSGFGL
jgi:PKD domain/Divergent InlB B-repeat domain